VHRNREEDGPRMDARNAETHPEPDLNDRLLSKRLDAELLALQHLVLMHREE